MQEVMDYINSFPAPANQIMLQLRELILRTAPEAVETIAYAMPAYRIKGKPLVYFAAYKNHIGFYATPTGHEAFSAELSRYKQGKGSVQFPLSEPMPYELIERIVAFRREENLKLAPKR